MLAALLLSLLVAGCGGGDTLGTSEIPQTPPPSKAIAESVRELWQYQQQLFERLPDKAFTKVVQGFDPKTYPSESAVGFLSAYAVAGDQKCLIYAKQQLDFARSLENSDHLLPFHGSSKVIAKVSQARLIWGYIIAYLATKDAAYLRWADDAAAGMMLLKRSPIRYKSTDHNVFHYTYSPDKPYSPIEGAVIDPNQEAIIGLVFTILYHTPASRFADSAQAKHIARENLDAVVAVQAEGGELPLTQNRNTQYDTMYGSFAAMGLYWANRYWKDPKYDGALRRAANWLGEMTRANVSERFYPKYYRGPSKEPVEMFYKLPLLYHFNVAVPDLKNQLKARMATWREFGDVPSGWIAPLSPMREMGVPDAFYDN